MHAWRTADGAALLPDRPVGDCAATRRNFDAPFVQVHPPHGQGSYTRLASLYVCVIAALVVSVGGLGLQVGAPWPVRSHDSKHSGRSVYSMGACPYGVTVLWSYTTGNNVQSSPAIGADGTVYIGSYDKYVYAFNGSTGALRWSYTTGGNVGSSPLIDAGGVVYVGSDDKHFYALNGSTGALLWNYDTGATVRTSPAMSVDGIVYIGNSGSKLYALNATGALAWNTSLGSGIYSSPAVGTDGTLYVGALDNRMYAIDGSTGALRWNFTTAGIISSSPALGADGTVYFGSGDKNVYALNGSTGALRWNYTTGDSIIDTSPAVGADGTVYVGSWDYSMYALNGSTGAMQWRYTTGGKVQSTPAIDADGTLYFGSDDNALYALNGSTGVFKWVYTAGGAIRSSPAIAADGTLYVGANDVKVYAFRCAPQPMPAPFQGGLQVGAPWPGRGHDASHSSRSQYSAVACTNGVAVRWNYTTGGNVQSSPAVGADGTVYVGSFDSNIYAFNGSTGMLRWNYSTGDSVYSSPAIGANGTLYVGSYDGRLYALNSSTGVLRWSFQTAARVYSSPTIGIDGTVFVGSVDSNVYALNGSTGTPVWTYSTGGQVTSSPALSRDGTLFVGSYDNNVHAINSSTGVKRWNYPTGGAVVSPPAVGADGTVYFGSFDHTVYALNGATGSLRWNYTTGNDIYSSPALAADGTVYITSYDNNVYALNGSTGALLWNYTTSSTVYSSPAVGADGTIYVGSRDTNMYALDGRTGALRWSYNLGGEVLSSAALGADGTVYVGSNYNTIYALWCAPPPTPSPSPSPSPSPTVSAQASLSISLTPSPAISPTPASQAGGLQPAAPWPARGHDTGHSGRSLYSMGACPYGVQVRWSYITGGEVHSSPAIGADGTVYVGSTDHQVYALNGSTGALQWNFTTGDSIVASAAISADNTLYIGSSDGNLYALHASNGSLRWNYTTGSQIFSSPTVYSDGTVYFGSNDLTLYALHGSTGAYQWSYGLNGFVRGSPALSTSGKVYVGSWDGSVYALDGVNKVYQWGHATGNCVESSPAVGADGTVYIGSWDNYVYALRGNSGATKWTYSTSGWVQSSPAIGLDGTVFVGSNDGNVYALNGSTGTLLWSYTTGNYVSSSPAIDADGILYVGSHDGKVYALNGTSGALLWSFQTGSQVYSSPAIGLDGTVYVGSRDSKVYALWCAPRPTSSTSPSPSPSPSTSASFSGSRSSSVSSTVSPSISASWSIQSSASPVQSYSISVSPSASPADSTAASTGTITPSPLVQLSFTPTSSGSGSLSVTSSASPAATTSVSPSQFAARATLQVHLPNESVGYVLLVSDSSPAVYVNLTVQYCRHPCTVSCSLSDDAVAVVHPSLLSFPAWSDDGEGVYASSSALLSVWAPFGRCCDSAISAQLTCQVHQAAPYASTDAQLRVSCLPTQWPLLVDAVLMVLQEHTSDVILKSAWGPPTNVTSMLLDASLISSAAAVAVVSRQSQPRSSPNVDTVSWPPFILPVTESSRVVLVAKYELSNGVLLPPFDNATVAALNGIVVPSAWVANGEGSGNLSLLAIDIPLQSLVCPSLAATEDCGYLQLTITTSDVIDSMTNSTAALGATLSCPPFCPNDFPDSIPYAIPTSASALQNAGGGTTLVPAVPQYDDAGPPVPVSLATLPSTGLYMTTKCLANGFTDPISGACTNLSDSRRDQCAFGAGAHCVQCPATALCPGGFRAWPLPGHFTAAESSGLILPCPPPALDRCLGWNASIAASQCGSAYLQGSYTCAACTSGFYPDPVDGSCTVCPYGGKPSVGQILQPVAILVGAILAVCACMYAVIVTVAKVRRADTSQLAKRTLQLGIWMWITLQNVAQIGRAASPGLPPIIAALYQQLAVLQFQGITVPSSCVAGVAFLNEMLIMSSVLLGIVVTTVVVWRLKVVVAAGLDRHGALLSGLYKLVIIGLTVVYPTATNAVFNMLACQSADISAASYAALTGDVSLIAAGGRSARSAVAVQVLVSDPSILCYRSAHIPVAVLAWIVLVLYCIGFPAAVVVLVGRRFRTLLGYHNVLPQSPLKITSQSIDARGVNRTCGCCDWSFYPCHRSKGLDKLLKPGVHVANTSQAASYSCCLRPLHARDASIDQTGDITSDRIILPFVTGDYRPSKYWFLAVDRAQFAALALIQTICRNSVALARVKLGSSIAVFCIAICMLWRYQPYARSAQWKSHVRLYTFGLCIFAACLNYATATDADDAVKPLAYICFAGSVVLVVILGTTFLYEAIIHMPQPDSMSSSLLKATGQ
jgi:outer membrane protein assembly factor BamB